MRLEPRHFETVVSIVRSSATDALTHATRLRQLTRLVTLKSGDRTYSRATGPTGRYLRQLEKLGAAPIGRQRFRAEGERTLLRGGRKLRLGAMIGGERSNAT